MQSFMPSSVYLDPVYYLRLIFFAVFDVISVISSLDFRVCEYVDAEFLFLLGETSASSLEM